MTNACLRHAVLLFLASMIVAGCERRETARVPGGVGRGGDVRQIELQPGQVIPTTVMQNPFEKNPYAVRDGERLYNWYNCSGCHFQGGGGIGPPLMDDDWIYGGEPQNIFDTIMEGRPEGMPSYRGKLPNDDAWKIVAYVQSLSADADQGATQREEKQEDTGEERLDDLGGRATPKTKPEAERRGDETST